MAMLHQVPAKIVERAVEICKVAQRALAKSPTVRYCTTECIE